MCLFERKIYTKKTQTHTLHTLECLLWATQFYRFHFFSPHPSEVMFPIPHYLMK